MAIWGNLFNQTPQGSQNPGSTYGPTAIRETRSEFQARVNKEHLCNSTSTVDGFHREGSFKCYYTDTEPQVRPDGTTELTSQDEGRLYINSDRNQLYTLDTDASFQPIINLFTPVAIYDSFYGSAVAKSSTWKALTWSGSFAINQLGITGYPPATQTLTFPSGTYFVRWIIRGIDNDGAGSDHAFQTRIRDTTNNSTLGLGATTTIVDPATLFQPNHSVGSCVFTLTAVTSIQLQVATDTISNATIYNRYFILWRLK